MRIKATQLLKVEDFPEQKSWIGKLISPINDFINQSIKIINDGIIYPDNFVGKDTVLKFTYQSDALSFPLTYQWPLLIKPKALICVAATEDGLPFIPALSWQFNQDGAIEITQVVRLTNAPSVELLQAGLKYELRVRVTP